jgi:Na+-transporting NADH:ubiquinone oxidoreductase subunit B
MTRPVWDANRLTLALAAGAAIPLAARIAETGAALVPALGLALALALVWQAVFSRARCRPMAWDGVVTALVFVLLVPDGVPLWQQALSLSFGIVLGSLIFGGRGRGFLNPVVVSLSFLLISFQGIPDAAAGAPVLVAAGVSGALLLALGLVSWRIVTGFALAAGLLALSRPGGAADLSSATLLISLVFLIADPVAAACTNTGRWLHGALSGALLILFATGTEAIIGLDPVISAAFLASLFAPLIDQGVIWRNTRLRARRQIRGGHHG